MLVQDIRDRLLARARKLGLEGDSEERLLDALLDHDVQAPLPSEADCLGFYQEHPDLFRSGDLIEADHILFAVTDRVRLTALRQRAQEVLDSARADPARFAALAREYSNCPSAQIGGNLGQLSRGDVVPEFWQAIATFAGIGVVPTLVETRHGLHVVRVTRRIKGHVLPYDAVRPRIADRLADLSLQQALRDYAHGLMHEAAAHDH